MSPRFIDEEDSLGRGTQPREIREEIVQQYAEAMQAGAKFPEVAVYFDGTDYWRPMDFTESMPTSRSGNSPSLWRTARHATRCHSPQPGSQCHPRISAHQRGNQACVQQVLDESRMEPVEQPRDRQTLPGRRKDRAQH